MVGCEDKCYVVHPFDVDQLFHAIDNHNYMNLKQMNFSQSQVLEDFAETSVGVSTMIVLCTSYILLSTFYTYLTIDIISLQCT